MQQIISFLNQGWVGTFVGMASLAVALFLYRRSRISGLIALQSRNVSMIAGGNPVFPDGVEVRYRGTLVPRLTSSTVWIWNAGKKTVEGSQIVDHDPLGVRFGGEVLNVRIKKVTREVLRIKATTVKEGNTTVRYDFDFLDPGDGGVIEVLHTGSAKAPECMGTIKGPSQGPRYFATFRPKTKYEKRIILLSSIMLIIFGPAMIVGTIVGEQYFKEAIPILAELSEKDVPPWFSVAFGLLAASFGGFTLWLLRSRTPSSLDVD